MVRKSGFRCRSSQITSMLRWASASAFCLQSPTRAHPVDIAVHVELQKVGRIITQTAGLLRGHPCKACGSKIEAIHESLDEADRVVRLHVIVHFFGQKQQLSAICS